MDLYRVIRETWQLLRQQPALFLPKLLTSTIWAAFWVYLVQWWSGFRGLTLYHFQPIALFFLIMTPIHVWVFTSYVHIVKQYHHNTLSMPKAFKKGVYRLPHALGAILITAALTAAAGLPGAFLAAFGYTSSSTLLVILGISLFFLLSLSTTVLFYLSPAAVILGEKSFIKNFRDGFNASTSQIKPVSIITIITFILLATTTVAQGALEAVGIIGFFLGRWLSALISVYLILVNPELLLATDQG